jgi:ankyrin repeat protein
MLSSKTINLARSIREIIRTNNDFSTLERLIKRLSKTHFTMTRSGWSLMHEAARVNNTKAIQILHKYKHPLVIYNDHGFNALHVAAVWNSVESIRVFITLGHPVDTFDHYRNTPLHLAVSKFNIESVSCLLECGANKSCKDSFHQTPKDLLFSISLTCEDSLGIETLKKLLS